MKKLNVKRKIFIVYVSLLALLVLNADLWAQGRRGAGMRARNQDSAQVQRGMNCPFAQSMDEEQLDQVKASRMQMIKENALLKRDLFARINELKELRANQAEPGTISQVQDELADIRAQMRQNWQAHRDRVQDICPNLPNNRNRQMNKPGAQGKISVPNCPRSNSNCPMVGSLNNSSKI
ncbi:MAG: hypothetical protein ACNS62_05505 [Candidatus Cyclobacteriaceae bacterium M3_2C_046]